MEREKVSLYPGVQFIHSGSTLLDCALGGGWAVGRIFNIVGDKSSGKTLQAIECFANFHKMFPTGKKRYGESEAAFDTAYATTLGFPSCVERPKDPLSTVEQFEADIKAFIENPSGPSLYILDSLDALSDDKEKSREPGAATYGADKAKELSKFFRTMNDSIVKANCTLGIISQVREDIGVTWGDGLTRSGGKALDFYASQTLWLKTRSQHKRTIKSQDRIVGVYITAKCKKNKVGLPFREADYEIVFGYGIDDESSMLDWLGTIQALSKTDIEVSLKELDKARKEGNREELVKIGTFLKERTKVEWAMLEQALAPRVRKYE